MYLDLTAERIADIARVFQSEPAVSAAWLFGSVGSGRATPFSDVDFAVLLQVPASQGLDRLALLDRIARGLATVLGTTERMVDVAAANDQGVVFQYQVIRTGRLVYEGDRKARELFAWAVLRHYLDFLPTLAIFDRARLGRGHSQHVSAPTKTDIAQIETSASKLSSKR